MIQVLNRQEIPSPASSTAASSDKKGRLTIGVDLGGTNLRIAAFDPEWNRLAYINLPTRVSQGPDAVVGDMCDAIRRVLEQCPQQLGGVGMGAPGPLELPSGKSHPHLNLPR